MCLTLRRGRAALKRYNRSKIRWKIGILYPSGNLVSYYRYFKYLKKGWMTAKNDTFLSLMTGRRQLNYRSTGFHVYMTRDDAEREAARDRAVVLRVEVKDFMRSGRFARMKAETYRKMKILEVIKLSWP